MSPWMQSAQNRAQTLGEIFPALADLLAYVAVEFDFERTLPGPTGELNRLRSEPRGSFIFMSDDGDSDNYRAYVAMALLTGRRALKLRKIGAALKFRFVFPVAPARKSL